MTFNGAFLDDWSVGLWGGFAAIALVMALFALAFYFRYGLRSGLYSVIPIIVIVAYHFVNLSQPGLDRDMQLHLASLNTLAAMTLIVLNFMAATGRLDPARLRQWPQALTLLALIGSLVGFALEPLPGFVTVLLAVLLAAAGLAGLGWVDLRQRRAQSLPIFLANVMCIPALLANSALALGPQRWPVHLVASMSGAVALLLVGFTLWRRYTYVLEVRQATHSRRHYDPLTRSDSLPEVLHRMAVRAGTRSGATFAGLLAVKFVNIESMESEYGRDASNLTLYVLASRMRRAVANSTLFAYLPEHTYVLVVQDVSSGRDLLGMAQSVKRHLSRPVKLNLQGVSLPGIGLHTAPRTTSWQAGFGIGLHAGSLLVLQSHAEIDRLGQMAAAAAQMRSQTAWYDDFTQSVQEVHSRNA